MSATGGTGNGGFTNRGLTELNVSSATVQNSLERADMLLAGMHGSVYKAVGSAVKRALAAGKTAAKKVVTQEYAITQSEFLKHTTNINHHYGRMANGDMVWHIGYAGYVIPLTKFKTRLGRDGRLTTQVKRANQGEVLRHAFRAKIYGHEGIFERVGSERFPVRELYGPATPQMMYSNEKVLDEIDAKVAETYAQRIEHEINGFLHGWR